MPRTVPPKNSNVAASTKDVVNELREKIRIGRLVPGQRLVEADIVKDTGASRSKVREALQRLESEGLILLEEFRGASVVQLSMDQVRQIYTARMALEGMAAREFAVSDNSVLKKKVKKVQEAMDDLEDSGDHQRFATLNDQWHALIIQGSGNSYIAHFLSQLSVPIYRLLFTSFYNAQRIDQANADHKLVTRAIIENKPDQAEKAMRDHIAGGLAALMEIKERLQF